MIGGDSGFVVFFDFFVESLILDVMCYEFLEMLFGECFDDVIVDCIEVWICNGVVDLCDSKEFFVWELLLYFVLIFVGFNYFELV